MIYSPTVYPAQQYFRGGDVNIIGLSEVFVHVRVVLVLQGMNYVIISCILFQSCLTLFAK